MVDYTVVIELARDVIDDERHDELDVYQLLMGVNSFED